MLRVQFRGLVRGFFLWTALAAGIISSAGVVGRLSADDVATTTLAPPAAAVADSLQRVFSGAVPSGVGDLKAMQAHVQKLTEQLAKCTVGVQVGVAMGSGVIVSKDGYVLTAAHVASRPRFRGPPRGSGDDEVTIYLSDGRKVAAKALGMNRTLDAGLLKITEPGEYPCAEMGASDVIKEGQWCVAMGHPGGYQNDRGPVLRLGRVLLLYKDESITTDCTLVGGDSGGPLFDMDGRVIGINSRIAGPLSANLHVPVSTYKESWDRMEKGEVWGRLPGPEPYLGVEREEGAKDARIAKVKAGSPAEQAGLKSGDVVVKFGDKEITDFESLKTAVGERRPGGRPIPIQVRRGEETIELRVRLVPRNDPPSGP